MRAAVQTTIEAHPSRRMPLIAIAVASLVAIALLVIAGAEQGKQKQDSLYDSAIEGRAASVLEHDSASPPGRTSDTAKPADLMSPTISDFN